MDEGFLEAIVHKRAPLIARARGLSGHVVLGRRLRPFTFWHQQLLQGIDSPFVTPDPVTDSSRIALFKNLYLAVEICSLKPLTFPSSKGWLAALRRKLAIWRYHPGVGARVLTRGVAADPAKRNLYTLLIEAAKFRFYLADYSSSPVQARSKNSKPVQSPIGLYQMSLYRRFYPAASPESVWRMSPGEVAWLNIGALEASGAAIEIMSEARLRARRKASRKGAVISSQLSGNGKRSK